ncbi:MAG: hypothetical protein GY809_14100 [Planctomycetes bacterium]|nr:hypothetical protein [Planctomycetota bacterium]
MMKWIAFSTLCILALSPVTPASNTPPHLLRVLTYNIHHAQGTDGKFDYQRLATIINRVKPDIVALQEVDRKTQRASGVDQGTHLAELTGMASVYGKAMDFSGGEYGQAILSRFPIVDSTVHGLTPKRGYEPRIMLCARIKPNNGLPDFDFAGTHLCHQSETRRTDQAKEINRRLTATGDMPVILAGDFNARSGSSSMAELLDTRWIDATEKTSRIDYILLRPNDPWQVIEVETIDEPVASDHKPVLAVLAWTGKPAPVTRHTRISIQKDRWFINEDITYPGAPAEGLLMNLRAVNSTFEDRGKPDFNVPENIGHFLTALPDYAAQGIRAFTLNLQGGFPGYEGAVNSAFNPDGTLRPDYLTRMERVIDACDQQGCVVILGCYYQRQDQILQDEAAVRQGVVNAATWIRSRGFTNVLLEISNEFDHGGFDHAMLKRAEGQIALIQLAKKTHPTLLVSTSGLGHGRMADAICDTADFILPHYNGTKLADIPKRISGLKRFGKPILCNEDDKTGPDAARAAELSVEQGASWGYMNKEVNQYYPFEFNGHQDDVTMYHTLKKLTSPAG